MFVFWLVFWALALGAQSGPEARVAAIHGAERSVVLLRNDSDLIPLRRLDTLRLAFWPIGLEDEGQMYDMLSRYAKVEQVSPAGTSSPQAWAEHLRARYNLLIIGVEDYLPRSVRPAYAGHEDKLSAVIGAIPSVSLVIGDGAVLGQLEVLGESPGLLYSPHNPFVYNLLPQVVFGAVKAYGRLEQDLSRTFRRGDGQQSLGGLRLRYGPPELAGMDGDQLRDSLRSIVQEGIEKGAYPGAQVIVAKDNIVVFREAFGHHTYAGEQAVDMDDLYDYASMTKITGALPALMKLYGMGRFELDAPLAYYFPAAANSNKGDLTFRRMLSHSARLRPWIPYWQGAMRGNARYPWQKRWDSETVNEGRFRDFTFKRDSSRRFPYKLTDDLWMHRRFRERKIYRAIEKSPLLEEPGYVYSGLLFYLLPDIVSGITGRDFEAYVNGEFYDRLGAHTITYNPAESFPLERIVPTEQDTFFRLELLHGVVHDEGAALMRGVSSNAGLFSTADDLAKLMQLYLNFGHYGGEQLILPEAMEEFTSYQYPEEGVRRGLGFDKPLLEYEAASSYVARSASPASFGHSGYTGTFAWADPETGLLFIFFSNRVHPTRNNRKLYTLNIRPRLHQACYDAIVGEATGLR